MRSNILEEMYIFLFLVFQIVNPRMDHFFSPLCHSIWTANSRCRSIRWKVQQGFLHGLVAGPVIWGSWNSHHFTTTFSPHKFTPWAPSFGTPTSTPPSIVYCPALYQTIKGKRLSPLQNWWKKSGKKIKRPSKLFRSNPECKNDKSQQDSCQQPCTVEKHCLSTKIHYGKTLSEQLWREYVIHLSVQHFWKTVKWNKPTFWYKRNGIKHCPFVWLAEKGFFRKLLSMHPLHLWLYSHIYTWWIRGF